MAQFTVPTPGIVSRGVTDETGRQLVMIVPESDQQIDPISHAPSLAKEIESEYGRPRWKDYKNRFQI
jgi:hypothetical protein